ncbi:MAG: hypothetical protein SVJ22_00600 [Halobacteriota archaeon]|nr:hypothetical protein [Halobacteriota archaeon]
MIRFRTDIFPQNETDGELVYDRHAQVGSRDPFTHHGLNTSKEYYYSAFAYDDGPKYSDGVVAPAAVSPVPELQTFILLAMGLIVFAVYVGIREKN